MAKVKGLYSRSVEDEHDKQIVYDTMYKTRWSLFQVSHTALHCVKTIQKVCRPVSDFLQVGLPRGRSDKTITSSKTIV